MTNVSEKGGRKDCENIFVCKFRTDEGGMTVQGFLADLLST